MGVFDHDPILGCVVARGAERRDGEVTPDTGFERALRFLRAADERASTSVERFEFGTAYLHDRLPRVWDRNFLGVETLPRDVEASALAAEAERIQGGAGLAHRKLVFDDPGAWPRLALELASGGWQTRRLALMTFARPVPGATPGSAREVESQALLPAQEQFLRSEPYGRDDDAVRQLMEADVVHSEAVGLQRCFASFEGGEVMAFCRLYSDGHCAQIEDVATLLKARARGHGTAVVAAALAAAAGSDIVFVLAVADDWPRRWYQRLGFKTVGHRAEAVLVSA